MLDTTSLCLSCCFLIKTYFHKKDSDKDLSLFICHSLKNEREQFSGIHSL